MSDMERIDEDPNAETDDTRVRVEAGEHDTYVLRREKYGLVEFVTAIEADDGTGLERYDWHTDEKFVLRGVSEAKQYAGMLADKGAFDPTTLFFRQFSPDDLDLEPARNRLERAMEAFRDGERGVSERHIQHAHAQLGGEKEDLYRDVDTDTQQGDR